VCNFGTARRPAPVFQLNRLCPVLKSCRTKICTSQETFFFLTDIMHSKFPLLVSITEVQLILVMGIDVGNKHQKSWVHVRCRFKTYYCPHQLSLARAKMYNWNLHKALTLFISCCLHQLPDTGSNYRCTFSRHVFN
jgi:hypothetical protein